MSNIYHFSRIFGMKKKYDDGGFDFWPEHYRYYGKMFEIKPTSQLLIVLCDNCDKNHACNDENCKLIYNIDGRIHTVRLVNSDQNKSIWIHCNQTIGTIYELYPEIIFGDGELISNNYLFNNVLHDIQADTTTRFICIFSPAKKPIINIQWNNELSQILCELRRGWNFFCICRFFEGNNTFYFYPTSKYVCLPVKNVRPYIQYYILYETIKPLSLYHLSLSSIVQNNLHTALKKNISHIYEKLPSCHRQHLLPFGRKYFNPICTGNGTYSSHIWDW